MDWKEDFGLPPWLLKPLRQMEFNQPLWLVGGAVRDWFLQREVHDFDFVTTVDGCKLARRLADRLDAAYYPLDEHRDTGRVVLQKAGETWHLDVASLRGRDLREDLLDRDFSINAMAVDVFEGGEIIDPTSGRADLMKKVIRPCSEYSLRSDPIRVLRAVRMAAALRFRLHSESIEQIRANLERLDNISLERVRDELFNILSLPDPAAALRVMERLGILEKLAMELVASPDPIAALEADSVSACLSWIEALDQAAVLLTKPDPERTNADLVSALFFNALKPYRDHLHSYLEGQITPGRNRQCLMTFFVLIHGLSRLKPGTDALKNALEYAGRQLRLSNAEIRFLTGIQVPEEFPGKTEVMLSSLRYNRLTGDSAVAGLLLMLVRMRLDRSPASQRLWIPATEAVQEFLGMYYDHRDRLEPVLYLNGSDLMELLSIKPGHDLGRLLRMLEEAQVLGLVCSKGDAVNFIQENGGRWMSIEETRRYLERFIQSG